MKSRKRTNNNVTIITIFIVILCSLVCLCIVLINLTPSTSNTNDPQALPSPIPIEQIIFLTSSSAQTQTAVLMPVIPTQTNTPELPQPTATIFIFELQTNVAASEQFIFSTNTPFTLATFPPQNIPQNCSCQGDTLNCTSFPTQSEAQTCFDYCQSLGYDDPNELDRDDDKIACENTDYWSLITALYSPTPNHSPLTTNPQPTTTNW